MCFECLSTVKTLLKRKENRGNTKEGLGRLPLFSISYFSESYSRISATEMKFDLRLPIYIFDKIFPKFLDTFASFFISLNTKNYIHKQLHRTNITSPLYARTNLA